MKSNDLGDLTRNGSRDGIIPLRLQVEAVGLPDAHPLNLCGFRKRQNFVDVHNQVAVNLALENRLVHPQPRLVDLRLSPLCSELWDSQRNSLAAELAGNGVQGSEVR